MATLVGVLRWTPEEKEVQRMSVWQTADQQYVSTDPLPTFCVLLLASGVLSYGLSLYQLLLCPL